MALCGMKCIDLTDDVIKILAIFFSHNKNLEQEKPRNMRRERN